MNKIYYTRKGDIHNLHYDFNGANCDLILLNKQKKEPLHIHDFHELAVVLSGAALHVIDDKEYPVIRGDVFVVHGNHRHTFKKLNELRIANFIFQHSYFEEIKKNFINISGFKALFIDEPQYRKNQEFKSKLHLNFNQLQEIVFLINSVIKEQEEQLSNYTEVIEKMFELVIIKTCRYYSKSEKQNTKSLLRISKALDYIENNYEKHITNEFLAQLTNMSETNFRYTFKKITRLSPIRFLVWFRIVKAAEIMQESPNKNVTEVFMHVGFENSGYFSTKFKEIMGISPMKYLQKMRAKVK